MNYLRFLAAFFILSICFSCKTKEVVKPNYPPSAFTVTATLADNGKDLLLRWTRSLDIDGDAVTYAVVYKDTLAKNLSDTTYIIKNLPYETEIKGSIVAKDLKGGIVNSFFSTKTNEDPYVKIPDINFEKALIELKIDDVQDGQLLVKSAEKVDSLNLYNKEIKSLQGIETFKNLKVLDCVFNQLTELDVSNNIILNSLYCSFNQLTTIDVSKNKALVNLSCGANPLKDLDVSNNKNLVRLSCGDIGLRTLNVKENVALTYLYCADNYLSDLDMSKNVNLTFLDCGIGGGSAIGNNLTNLNVSNNINLTTLNCGSNKIKNIDISKNIALINFYCTTNQLSSLNISKNINLKTLWCNGNNLTSIDTSNNPFLTYIECSSNFLNSLDISKNVNLNNLYCTKNKVQTICVINLNQVKSYWQKDPTATYKVCN